MAYHSDYMSGFGSLDSVGAPLQALPDPQAYATNDRPPMSVQQQQPPAQVLAPLQQQQPQYVVSQPRVLEPARPAAVMSTHPGYYVAPQVRRPSYWDNLWASKREMGKMMTLALIVTIALSIHSVAKFYLQHVLTSNTWSFSQELWLRVAYPVIAIFFVWNFKVALSSK